MAGRMQLHTGLMKFLLACLLVSTLLAQSPHEGNKPFPGYKIIGNIYYVGATISLRI